MTKMIDFIEENGIEARLLFRGQDGAEYFMDEDGYLTTDEEASIVYEAQDMEELVGHVQKLEEIMSGLEMLFFTSDGCNVTGKIKQEDLEEDLPYSHFLRELV